MRIIGNDPSTPRQTKIVASGTLSTGDAVVVNSDGTVSAAGINTISTSLGSASNYTTASTASQNAVYDTVQGKVVIVYVDETNNDYGTAVVGTVNPSNNSITFGTPVVFESAEIVLSQVNSVAYDAASGNIVIVYRDYGNSNYGTAIVGTVSGTSISFGTAAVYKSGNSVQRSSVAYSTEAGKVLITYTDASVAAEDGKAVVGTVSGTSISFGSEATFNTTRTSKLSLAYSPSSDSFLLAYTDSGNSSYGTAVVGTISGTSVSFGSETVFYSGTTDFANCVYDPSTTKFIISYRDGSDSLSKALVATVSGTSVSFGSAASSGANGDQLVMGFDENVNKPVLFFRDGNNSLEASYIIGEVSGSSITFGTKAVLNSIGRSDFFGVAYDAGSKRLVISTQDRGTPAGAAHVLTVGGDVSNITSENYIGTVASGVSSGNGAKINLKGAVDENQSGLTAGQSYYVQTDGTLGTTADDPNVFAGTAVAANKLIVKG